MAFSGSQITSLQIVHPGRTKSFTAKAVTPTIAVTGTITASATEEDIVAGGQTIILTVTNDTWVAEGATFDAQRQNIIDGLDSAGSEGTGWNAEVRDKEVVGAVVRTSDTVVTITLTAAAAYDITASETITVTIPASALTTYSDADLTATPTFDVDPVAATTSVGLGGGGIDWQRPRKRRRRNETKKLFDAIERTLRESLEGPPSTLRPVVHVGTQAEITVDVSQGMDAVLDQLLVSAAETRDLSAQIAKLKRAVRDYERKRLQAILEDDEEVMLLL